MAEEWETWQDLEESIRNCRKCEGLNIAGRTQSCPGYGHKESPIMLVGQSLCKPGMKTQIPFSGGSGLILDKTFKRLGMQKKYFFISNVVKCHPPNNRASKPIEKKNCLPYLVKEIELLKPKLVIALGLDAAQAFLGRIKISDVVNQRFSNGNFTLIPMFHPAYLMRKENKLSLIAYIKRFVETIESFLEVPF